ncbi:hypothetical protein PUMCH_000556 [Australozyma saopauloensis]|uniref:Vacuolar protein sorting-associated protein 8 central domain-containing protein n=1 Tax=Australozyma saopauloensis TaxID=291208 RepID=A0AAX4H521_9ASCO|nr:hypothetical protein PUMCH_000556 [[Candida] saopauloensis]
MAQNELFQLLPSSASTSTVPTVSSMRLGARKRFDDRSQTAIALLLRSRVPGTAIGLDNYAQLASECNRLTNILRWTETARISRTLNSAPFISQFGSASVFALSPSHILVGTSKGAVAAFDYSQRLSYMLFVESVVDSNVNSAHEAGPRNVSDHAATNRALPITCVAYSSDGLFVAAGQNDGTIVLWDISKATLPLERSETTPMVPPYNMIYPRNPRVTLQEERIGHTSGVPITNVMFLDDLHQYLLSSDCSGLVLYHHGFKKFLRKHLFSEKILGPNDIHESEVSTKTTIFDCQLLPHGTSPQVTDLIGLTAVITSNILKVVSVRSLNNTSSTRVLTHFKVFRSKKVDMSPHLPTHGCLAWYPCLNKDGGIVNAKLAYSWNNVVTILEVNNNGIPSNILSTLADVKDKDKAIPIIPLFKTAKWHTPEPTDRIVALKWLNSEILTVIAQNTTSTEFKLHVLYYTSFELNAEFHSIGLDNLESQIISDCKMSSTSKYFQYQSYQSSFQIFRHRPVLLAQSRSISGKAIFTGTNLKWGDRIMQLLVRKDFMAALLSAYDFYHSTESGKLILCGLPHTELERQAVVEPFLVKLMKEAVEPLFKVSANLSVEYESPRMSNSDLLRFYFHLVSLLTQNRGGSIGDDLLNILELIRETLDDDTEFFSLLEEFIIGQAIPNLSPILFEKLIQYLVSTGKESTLTETVCLLETSTLNIDATLKLCEENKLRECSTYIWNKLLHDYLTPLITLISDFCDESLSQEQKMLVFSYLSYVLSGRQFPTDDYLSDSDEERSRREICATIFSYSSDLLLHGESKTVLGTNTNSVFPFLTHLLKFSVRETLMTMNEFFENPCLNDGEIGYDRQDIIEALLDIFEIQEFTDEEHVYLAIFIARNYPKFIQFIRLSDSVLQDSMQRLCNNKDIELHDECELALQSLIQAYNVGDESFFYDQLKAAKFHNVLFSIYKQKGEFSQAIEVWLKTSQNVEDGINFSILAEILESTFLRSVVSPKQKKEVLNAIQKNFSQLATAGPADLAALANAYNPEIHLMAVGCDDPSLQYKYLKELFDGTSKVDFGTHREELLITYLKVLCQCEPAQVMATVREYSGTIQKYLKQDDSLLSVFRNFDQVEALCHFLVLENKTGEALELLLEKIDNESSKKHCDNLEKYIDAAVQVCEASDGTLWNKMIQRLVQLTSSTSTAAMEMLDHGIYRLFRRLLDTNPEPEMFQGILHDIMDSAQVSNIRETLQDLLTSYFFEIEMLSISLKKINTGVLKYMHTVRNEILQGWGIEKKLCASCGLPICGKDISVRQFMAWEDRQRSRVVLAKFDKDDYLDCEIVLFKCHHGYHSKCLRNLGSWGHCVLCEA